MKKKQCSYCGKTYKPKSNNSKYCSPKCKYKRDNEWKAIQRKNNPEWRKKANKRKREKWKDRYYTEDGFKERHHERQKKYRSTEKGKQKDREISKKIYYQNHEENKKKQAKRHREKYWKDKEYRKQIKIKNREYKKTENGKIADKRHRDKRRRELKVIPLWINPFPTDIEIDYHHINNILTIPIPKTTHHYSPGVNKEKHLQHNEKWIKKIYCFDIKKLEV